MASACGVFPLVLRGQAEIFSVHTITPGLSVSIPQLRSPVAECRGHVPIYTNCRIIVKCRVPEVVTSHRLVVGVRKVTDPYQGIRIYIDLTALYKGITWGAPMVMGGLTEKRHDSLGKWRDHSPEYG